MNIPNSKSIIITNNSPESISHSIFALVWNITMEYEKLTDKDFVNLLLVTDTEMRDFNRKYRGNNSSTDVLSFTSKQKFIPLLGDIVINIQAAKKVKNNSLERELQYLFLHGLLHLLGYDHITEKQKNEMFEREKEYRKFIDAYYE